MLGRMWENLDRPPLDARTLRRALVDGPQGSWARVDVVDRTGSTNADLLASAADLPDRSALVADFQASARGRHLRPWSAPAGSQLAVSALFRFPGIDPAVLGWLPLLTGVAVVDVLRSVAEVDAELKWPNDVLIGGRKVAGILAEVAPGGPVPTVVVGIGLNVSMTADELPVPTATSLAIEKAAVLDRDTLVRSLLRTLGSAVDVWRDAGWDSNSLAEPYRARCGTLGRRVRVIMPGDNELIGTATDVDADGRIVVVPEGSDSAPVAVSAGDVTHLRTVV
ncbi:biotin--[acetyl-CoA-carboxylase] ligase [Rhodococcoides trifolii]|uniref:biotin--[biotin carboxyl-carrier protein] ligase n=2 Tax=Rhodococcoides trifolii TaxID=908250 RepID=A0A917D5N3_9NOCA|nr:biotin--[acetyl-CoA-carboxylase] ligase [Rhodococcus trifolii]